MQQTQDFRSKFRRKLASALINEGMNAALLPKALRLAKEMGQAGAPPDIVYFREDLHIRSDFGILIIQNIEYDVSILLSQKYMIQGSVASLIAGYYRSIELSGVAGLIEKKSKNLL